MPRSHSRAAARRAASVVALCLAIAAGAWSCSSAPPAPRVAIDLSAYELVDLTYAFDEETVYWPTSPSGFELEELAHGHSEGGWFYSAYRFRTPEHGGTHLDAPIHFAEGGDTTDRVPLGRLVAPAVVIDVARKAATDPDYLLSVADVEAFEIAYGVIPEGTIVLLRTGWGQRWGDRLRYLGDDTPGDASNLHFPSFGEEAARLLVQQRGVAALGVDTASIDRGASSDFRVHQVAAAADVPGFENVANLDSVPPVGAWVIALPMKIAGGSGGPLRIAALVPR